MMELTRHKQFTRGIAEEAFDIHGCACAWCGVGAAGWQELEYHHKKARAHLSWLDVTDDDGSIKPGGGVNNCIPLCFECHRNVHEHRDGWQEFHTSSSEEVT